MSNHFLLFFWLFLLIVFVSMYWRASHVSVCHFSGQFVVAHICGHNGAADANKQVEKCSVWILKHLLKALCNTSVGSNNEILRRKCLSA